MCLVRCLSQHTYRIPFRGKDKMKICLDVGDKLSSLLRGMNLSMSVASSACLHIKKHRIVSSSPRTFACLHNNDAKHNSFVRFAVVRFFADRNCEFILAAERKKNTHTQEVVYSMYVWLSHLRCSFCFWSARIAFSVVCIFQFTLFILPNGISCHIFHVYITHIVYRI